MLKYWLGERPLAAGKQLLTPASIRQDRYSGVPLAVAPVPLLGLLLESKETDTPLKPVNGGG